MNDKRASSTDIHDIKVAQFSCEDAWAKRSVPANVDTPEEHNESHTGIKKKAWGALRHYGAVDYESTQRIASHPLRHGKALLLLPEPVETIRELWTSLTFVRKLGDEQRERLRVTGDP